MTRRRTGTLGLVPLVILSMFASVSSSAAAEVCDADGNGAVDLRDIRLIFDSIGETASGADDPRDSNGDGKITVNDARDCVSRCALPGCALPPANTPPLAHAGPDQSVKVYETVILDGSASSDADGDSLTFLWSFRARPPGSMATLSEPTAVMPEFFVDRPGDYELQLVVNDGTVDSQPDSVVISTTNSPPVAHAGPDQTVLVGETVTLDGSASSDVDGDALTYLWRFDSVPTGSLAGLSGPTSVSPTFVPDEFGQYVVELIVNDGNVDSAPDLVLVTTENSAPVADAGPDQLVFVGDAVTLDGSGSSDVDGDTLTYRWSFVSSPPGSSATLADSGTVSPSFDVDEPGLYVVQLIVNDGTVDSVPDTVSITTENSAPVANAGPNQTVFVGDTVVLDGSGSSDVDGDSLTFAWSLTTVPPGSGAILTDPSEVFPTFEVDEPGTYVAQLIVNDGTVDSAPDTVMIDTENSAPVADAGPDQTVFVTDIVVLDGSGSFDADGDSLTYLWSLTSLPAGSAAVLDDPTALSPTFAADLPGSYVLQLIVNDGSVDSAPDTVLVTTENSAPVADAGPDQTALVTSTVVLDGSASSDVDGDPLTYSWTFASKPPGSTATLTGETTVSPTFVVDVPGTYEVQLLVSDGLLDSAPDSVTITTENSAPVADAGPDQSVFVGDTVMLDGSGSADVDGDPLTYAWTLLSTPAGSTAALVGETAVSPTFVADLPGTYEAQLIVSDGLLDSAPDTVAIAVSVPLTLTLVPETRNLLTLETGSLTVILSSAAGPGGVLVDVAIDDPNVATVPPTVLIPEGALMNAFDVIAGAAAGSAVVSVSAAGFSGAASIVVVASRDLALSTDSPLVGVGRAVQGRVSITPAAPPGGAVITLSSDDESIATVSPGLVTIPEGETSAPITVDGIALGTTTLRANAAGYRESTTDITTTDFLVSIDNMLTVAPGQTSGLAVSLTKPAPPGGTTINFQTSASSIATITPSVFVPEGGFLPLSNPQVTGVSIGSATVTATAAGFAPDTRPILVTIGLSFSPPVVTIPTGTSNLQLNLSAPASAGGLVVDISSDNTAVVGVPATVTVLASQTSVQVPVTGIASGSTTIRASAPGIAEATAAVTVGAGINVGDVLVGDDLQRSLSGSLGAPAPAGGVVVTITSLDPARVLVSSSSTILGGPSTFVNVTAGSTFLPSFYIQGLADVGSVVLEISAPGFVTHTSTVTLAPSGFRYVGSVADFTTTTFSANTQLQISSARLSPGTFAFAEIQALRPGLSVSVDVASSDPSVGVVTPSPVVLNGGESNIFTAFDPIAAGVTTLTVVTPSGFETPNLGTQRVATVTAPNILLNSSSGGSVSVGNSLQTLVTLTLAAPPPAPVDVTVTVGSGTIATISGNRLVAGGESLTFTGVSGTLAGTFALQGQSKGTTALTATAAGYNTNHSTASVTASGFRFTASVADINTTTFSANSSMQVSSVQLADGSLATLAIQEARPGINVPVAVTSSNTAVGVITVSPLTFSTSVTTLPTAFDPIGPGTSTLTVQTPAGFDTPNTGVQRNANVTAPKVLIGLSASGAFRVGDELQLALSVSLEAAPPSPVDVTVTLGSASIATVSADPLLAGGPSVTFPGVSGTTVGNIFVQGRSIATTGMTATAPGFSPGSYSVEVVPSGFRFIGLSSPSFETTTFSANTTLSMASVALDPSTHDLVGLQPIRGGFGVNVDVTSSMLTVGAVSSPASFAAGVGGAQVSFDPLTAGTSLLSIIAPPGFVAPSAFAQLTATVRAPDILFSGAGSVGLDLQRSVTIFFEAPPPEPVEVTVAVNSGSIATISEDGTAEGVTNLTFPAVTTTNIATVAVQGRALGSTTLTVQAAGYADASIPVNVTPSGFRVGGIPSGGFTTSVGAANTIVGVNSIRLDPTTLLPVEFQPVRGGVAVNVEVTSSSPSVGVITMSPLEFTGGVSQRATAFDPISVGTTDLAVEVPPGFSPPSAFRVVTATVVP